jgi:hypothetical protein
MIKIVMKVLIDRIIFAPPFVLFTIAFLQFFQHFNVQRTIRQIGSTYHNVLMRNEQVWVIAQWINFHLIPVDFQVLFVNAVSIAWNTLLSLSI